MRYRFPAQSEDRKHTSRKPLSTRNLPARGCFLLTLLACALPALAFAGKPLKYAYTGFDVPGSIGTSAITINNEVTITGRFADANNATPGFVWIAGVFNRFELPGAVDPIPWGINDNGTIVGRYHAAAGKTHGFLISGGTYTSIDYPNAVYTTANGINDAGEIVGRWDAAAGHTHGFYAVKQ